LENLRWVCPNCNQQLDTTGSKNIKNHNKFVTICVDCGREISKGCVRCFQCNNKFQAQQKVNNYPISREELKEKIRTTTFVSIAKELNCSDNMIKKYCIG
jgi:predicted amidophosphoribosyltransferase